MELETTEYDRKTFTVNAVELTFKNVEQVAKWCKGTVDTETTRLLGGADTELPVIKVQGQGEDKGKTLVARLGYFVVESKGRFRVYKAPQFHAAFEKHVEEPKQDKYLPGHLSDGSCCPDEEDTTIAGIDDSEFTEYDNSSVDGQETVHVNLA
jgi:hypothetical protein